MTADQNFEDQLATWFNHRTTTPSPDLLPRAVARIGRVGQRPGFLTRDRYGLGGDGAPERRLLVPAVAMLILLLATAMAVGFGSLVQPSSSVFATTEGIFAPADRIAFRAALDPADGIPQFRWRAGAYAEYRGSGWGWGVVDRVPRAAGERVEVNSLESARRIWTANEPQGLQFQIVLTPDGFRNPTVLGPKEIQWVDEPVDAVTLRDGGWFTSIERRGRSGSYTVFALLPLPSDARGGLNEASLRGAGDSYPAAMLATYTQLPDGALGPASLSLLEAIRASVPDGQDPDNAYDLARAIETYLSDDANFDYDADVRAEVSAECGGMSTVECFATIRRGYCDYYASTMAALLRESGIPARIAYGFLGGERSEDGVEVVGEELAHWWVEVYFPRVGWFPFDPTGGGVGRPSTLPAGT
jgi:hypothetical protein